MRLFPRHHRGSQSEAPTPSVSRPVPAWLTARQVLTASLAQDKDLAWEPSQVRSIVHQILIDLQANGLEIVASSEVEDAPEVLQQRETQKLTAGWPRLQRDRSEDDL